MSKITKTALISIGAGILLCLLAYMLVGGVWTGFNSKGNEYIEESYESGTDIKELVIDESSNSIIMQSEDTDKITIEYYDNPDSSMYVIEEKDGKLKFKRNDRKFFKLINIDFTERNIVVTVPSDYKGDMSVELTSGSLKADDITADDLKLDCTSGSIKLNNVKAKGDIDIDCTSGSIKFENLASGGDIEIDCTSGSVKGTIDEAKSDYTIRSETTAGSSNLSNTDGGRKKLDVETTAGSINIEFTK